MTLSRDKLKEPLRFAATGLAAAVVQYAVYYALLPPLGATPAWTVGFVVSLAVNYLLTTYFTFRVKPGKRNAGGFALGHLINWAMQTLTLNVFIWIGVPKTLAPLPMYAICAPLNYLMLRLLVKKLS